VNNYTPLVGERRMESSNRYLLVKFNKREKDYENYD